MAYDHKVLAIFNPSDATGFVYTVGMYPMFELFALDVPYHLVNEVCSLMNFLSRRIMLPKQTAQHGDLIFYISPVCAERRAELMETHLLRMQPDAKILELCPISGWPKVEGVSPADHCDLKCSYACNECRCVPCEV